MVEHSYVIKLDPQTTLAVVRNKTPQTALAVGRTQLNKTPQTTLAVVRTQLNKTPQTALAVVRTQLNKTPQAAPTVEVPLSCSTVYPSAYEHTSV